MIIPLQIPAGTNSKINLWGLLQELLGSLRFVSTPRTGDTQMADIYPVD